MIPDFVTFSNSVENPIVSLLEYYRDSELPNFDELILNSGGPVTDLSGHSFLPCLQSVRILFFEPLSEAEFEKSSALQGDIKLGNNNLLTVLVQKYNLSGWDTVNEYQVETLEKAIKIAENLELPYQNIADYPIIPGGFTGILGYDLNRWSVGINLSHNPQDGTLLGVLWRSDAWWIHDRNSDQLSLISVPNHPWLEDVRSNGLSIVENNIFSPLESFSVPESESDASHARKVDTIKESIRQGHFYQLNYGRKWSGNMPSHPWYAFQRMTEGNPSPFASWLYVHDHGWSIASASPERLLKTNKGMVSTRPIKGTYPRGKSLDEDRNLQIEMVSSEKEIAEHLMLVDLKKHDLSKICEPGSVHWSDFRIEALSTVQHLVSGVSGKLISNIDFGKIISALFPGGSITGCPKIASIAAINEIEESPRGAWTGSIGHFHSNSGISEFNILIRTLESHSGPNQWHGRVQAGGGIVIGSNSSSEVEEARWKAAAITDSTWGFRTGFSTEELPKRDVEILPIPEIEGPINTLKLKSPHTRSNIGDIIRGDSDISFPTDVLLIDNLDSFTENIANSIVKLGFSVRIVDGRPKNHSDSTTKIKYWLENFTPKSIIIGPGPSRPEQSEITMEIAKLAVEGKIVTDGKHIPVLGLCLGHQALGLAVGWDLIESPKGAIHGVPSMIKHDNYGLYNKLDSPLILMRYNSLILIPKNEFMICDAWDNEENLVMGIRHPIFPVFGIQFHPESVGSPQGYELILSFLEQEPVLIDPISNNRQVRRP